MLKYISPAGARIEEVPWVTPEAIFSNIHHLCGALWLDSQKQTQYGQSSFIAAFPNKLLSANAEEAPFNLLNTYLKANENPWADLPDDLQEVLPLFRGGIAGVFGYELGGSLEKVKTNGPLIVNGQKIPDLCVGFYPSAMSFDHTAQRCFVIATGFNETGIDQNQAAETQLNKWRSVLDAPMGSNQPPSPIATVKSNFTRTQYMQAVSDVIALICNGEIFQANISQSYTGELEAPDDGFSRYLKMRALNPASFGGFFRGDNWNLASNSPERLITLNQNNVSARPIKGTVTRSQDPIEDQKLADQLLMSTKDRAENIMIVDLLRNDLARVCEDSSINVTDLCVLESLAHVHHLVSTVSGTLRNGQTPIDLLAACFPGGSVTGAPKIRAMDIITEIEQRPRGPYCGSLGYIGFDGHMDMNILIRSIIQSGSELVFNVGGGITAQSNPSDEYQETLDKAEGLFRAIGLEEKHFQEKRA